MNMELSRWVVSAVVSLFGTVHSPAPAQMVITTGRTYQQLVLPESGKRHSLVIQNINEPTDADHPASNCWISFGEQSPSRANSILLMPDGAFTQYWPRIAPDQVMGTCDKPGSKLYVRAD